MTFRRLSVTVALTGALTLACSDADSPVSPRSEVSPPEPLASHDGTPPPVMDGPFDLPVPANNLERFGSVGPFQVTSLDTTTFVEIEVQGTLSFSKSSQFCGNEPPPDPLYGATVGPFGGPDGGFHVSMRMGRQGIPLRADPDDEGRAFFAGDVFPGPITVQRSGGGYTCAIIGGPRDGEVGWSLDISGSQTVTVTPKDPFQVHADRSVILEGEEVTFEIDSEYDVSPWRVWWSPNDTLAEPNLATKRGVACGFPCTFEPNESGRLYVVAFINGLATRLKHSQRVWVRKDFDGCELPEGVIRGPSATRTAADPSATALPAPSAASEPFDEETSDQGPLCPLDPGEDDEEEPEDSLVVTLSPTSARVEPVLDRRFDAVAQTWRDSRTGPRVNDLVDLAVSARWEPSGRPAATADVRFTVEPQDGSGGHPHGSRPPGTFFQTGDHPTGADQKKGVRRSSLDLTTDVTGSAEAVYRTSGVSGIERVKVEVSAEGETATRESTVTIRLGPLTAVPRAGIHYVFEGSANSHFDTENYLAPGVIEHMEGLWGRYRELHEVDPVGYPMTGRHFTVTGASVIWGGLFDINQDWANPHNTHRLGRDIDIDNAAAEAAPAGLQELCSREAYVFEGIPTTCTAEGNHFHVFVGRTFYHR